LVEVARTEARASGPPGAAHPVKLPRLLGAVGGFLALGIFLAMAGLAALMSASLPSIAGRERLPGLQASASIERDAAGVPTLRAADRRDLARVLGYAHGQDRFFQMDLLRRAAAGELSALFGPVALPADRKLRVHRFRQVAHAAVSGLDPESRALLEAYVDGVNAGLASLGSRPFEYWVLGSVPKPWNLEDTVLCAHAMYLDLQDASGHGQLQRGLLRASLPAAAARFLESGAPEWDAAIDGSHGPEPVIPGANDYDLRSMHDLPIEPPVDFVRRVDLGSNNWAVAGVRTRGAAVVANDMHLDYRVPNIWYRARLVSGGPAPIDVTGVTLPGSLAIVAGSNGSIAWGFTNSYGQYSTLIRLEPVPNDPTAYRTAHGIEHLVQVDEPIEVKGAPTEHLAVASTPWGPVVGHDWEGWPVALQWTAHDPAATNLRILELERARSSAAALALGAQLGIPGQNLVVADREGHIGWTIAGRIPRRDPERDGLPQRSSDPQVGFQGWIAPSEQPRMLDPPEGLLWTANARVIGGAGAALIGDDGRDRGARAGQIALDLRAARTPFSALDSLRIQLDDRARFLERWRALLSDVLARERTRDASQESAQAVLAGWSGHAAADDAAYRWVRRFRNEVEARVFFMLVAPARRRAPGFEFEIPSSFEGPLWRVLEARPMHLLAARYADWDALLRAALVASEALPPQCRRLQDCTWGQVNAVHVEHPLARALPPLAGLLDEPVVQVAGAHHDMPRIQGPDYGASERFSVAPGDEGHGYFHMPGGESGHPFSPFYRAGFQAWRDGRPTPFLPGIAQHTLSLLP